MDAGISPMFTWLLTLQQPPRFPSKELPGTLVRGVHFGGSLHAGTPWFFLLAIFHTGNYI